MRTVFTTFVLLIVTAVPLAAQDAVSTARELYASARYDEALAALNSLRAREDVSVRPADVRALEQVRSLCLLALGRASEAEEAIAAVVAVDPFYQPSDADAAPRVRAAFQEVRRRMLPEIASERYAAAKATYERKEHAAAVEQFQQAIALLDDPDMQGRLADLRMLAGGFLELSVSAVKAAEPAKPVEPPPPPPPAVPAAPKIYTPEDTEATPPATVRQELPKMPSSLMSQARDRGIVEVVVDQAGRVESAAIRVSIHTVYDAMLLGAAADWRYRPAIVNGQPVKFRKRIAVSISRR
jgi:tetratricopeptide (TPR) repeat protein